MLRQGQSAMWQRIGVMLLVHPMGKEEAKVDDIGVCFYDNNPNAITTGVSFFFFNCHLIFRKKMEYQTELPIYLKFLWNFSLSLALPALGEASVTPCHVSKPSDCPRK